MTSEQVITEARSYADRLARQLGDTEGEREEFSKAAFLAYLQGFKAGLVHDVMTLSKEARHD